METARPPTIPTPSEVWRTAWQGIDRNERCPGCKGDDTDQIRDTSILKPYQDFYGAKPFRAMFCNFCGAQFSFVRSVNG